LVDGAHDARQLGDPTDPRSGRVEPAASVAQVADRAERVAAGHEWAHVGAAAQPLCDDLGPDVEPNNAAAAEEPPAVARVDDRAAARGDHPRQLLGAIRRAEGLDRGALAVPEAGLALRREDFGDPHAGLSFDLLVEVDE